MSKRFLNKLDEVDVPMWMYYAVSKKTLYLIALRKTNERSDYSD